MSGRKQTPEEDKMNQKLDREDKSREDADVTGTDRSAQKRATWD